VFSNKFITIGENFIVMGIASIKDNVEKAVLMMPFLYPIRNPRKIRMAATMSIIIMIVKMIKNYLLKMQNR